MVQVPDYDAQEKRWVVEPLWPDTKTGGRARRGPLARIIRGGLDSDTSGVWKVAGVGLRWT